MCISRKFLIPPQLTRTRLGHEYFQISDFLSTHVQYIVVHNHCMHFSRSNHLRFLIDRENFLLEITKSPFIFRCTGIPSPPTTQSTTLRTSKQAFQPLFSHFSCTNSYPIHLFSLSHHTPLRLHTSRGMQQTRLQHAAWLGNTSGILMISENDIYVRIAPSAAEDARITDTGLPGVIYNGVPDWLYQEEVLPRPEAAWPSSDGTHLLFASFNDTKVTALEFPWFSTQPGQDGPSSSPLFTPRRGSFPPSRSVRYPTPGSPNPEVELWIMELGNLTNSINGTANSTTLSRIRLKPPTALDGQ